MKAILTLIEFNTVVLKAIAVTIQAYTGHKSELREMDQILSFFMHNDKIVDAMKKHQDAWRKLGWRTRLMTDRHLDVRDAILSEIISIMKEEKLELFGLDGERFGRILLSNGMVQPRH